LPRHGHINQPSDDLEQDSLPAVEMGIQGGLAWDLTSLTMTKREGSILLDAKIWGNHSSCVMGTGGIGEQKPEEWDTGAMDISSQKS
jgi:hypothetical protein